MKKLYDVVFFGIQPDKNSDEVAQAIATAFSVPLDKAKAFVTQPSGTLVKKGVPAETAEQFQTRLVNAGAKANCKPSVVSAAKLELTPINKTEDFNCPACGKVVEASATEERPLTCPHCHIVFTKFEQNRKRMEEEKQIRDRLQRMQHLKSAEDERNRQQKEEEDRQKQLEENVRKQLGLAKKVVSTRTGLISSASLLLLTGLGLGLLSNKLFLSGSGKLPPSQTSGGLATSAGTLDMETLTQTANQIVANQTATSSAQAEESSSSDTSVASAVAAATTEATNNSTLPPSEMAKVDEAASAAQSAQAPSQEPGIQLDHSNGQDPEWDAFLLSQVQANLAQDALAHAGRLALAITDPQMRYSAQMDIVLGHQRLGQTDAAKTLLNETLNNIASSPSLVRRVELATNLVETLTKAKQPVLAAHVLVAAEPWLKAIKSPGEQVEAWSSMAKAQTWLGFNKDSDTSIERAVAALRQPMPALARVQAMSKLAETLHQRGARNDAENILAQARELAETIEQQAARDEALALLVRALAHNDELSRAVEIAQKLDNAAAQDRLMLELLQRQALTGQLFGLTSVAEMIATPVNQARAYAMLGRTSTAPEIAEVHFQHAATISERLKDPTMQVMLLGEIARYRSRISGQADFAQAEKRLQQLSGDPQQEAGLASLVANAARAGNLALAKRYLGQISAPKTLAHAREDLAKVQQAVAAMPGAT